MMSVCRVMLYIGWEHDDISMLAKSPMMIKSQIEHY